MPNDKIIFYTWWAALFVFLAACAVGAADTAKQVMAQPGASIEVIKWQAKIAFIQQVGLIICTLLTTLAAPVVAMWARKKFSAPDSPETN